MESIPQQKQKGGEKKVNIKCKHCGTTDFGDHNFSDWFSHAGGCCWKELCIAKHRNKI